MVSIHRCSPTQNVISQENLLNRQINYYTYFLSGASYAKTMMKRENIFSLTCNYSQFIWAHYLLLLFFFGYLKNTSTCPQNIDETINLLITQKNATKRSILLCNLIGGTLWSIWLERNSQIFRDKNKSLAHMSEDILNLSSLWCKKRHHFSSYDVAIISLNQQAFLQL